MEELFFRALFWIAEVSSSDEYVSLLKKIHSTEVPDGKLPDFKETANDWADFMLDYLPPETGKKLKNLIDAVPFNNHMIHGDYHTKNVVLAGDEVLLIDMDTLAVGDPVFEFGSIFNAFKGFSELDPHVIEEFQGFSKAIGQEFWSKVLAGYAGTDDPAVLQEMEDKARVLGYTRLIRRSIRRKGLEEEKSRAEIELWKAELIELVDKVDSLSYECWIKKRADAEKAKARVLFFCEIRRSAASGTRFHSKPCPDPLAQAGFAKLSCPSCSIY